MSVPGILVGGVVGVQATSRVWLIGLVTLSVDTHEGACEEMTNVLEESSTLEDGGAPRAMDTGLFGVKLPKAWLEVSSAVCDKSSWTSAVMLMWSLTLGGCSMVRCVGEVGIEVS